MNNSKRNRKVTSWTICNKIIIFYRKWDSMYIYFIEEGQVKVRRSRKS